MSNPSNDFTSDNDLMASMRAVLEGKQPDAAPAEGGSAAAEDGTAGEGGGGGADPNAKPEGDQESQDQKPPAETTDDASHLEFFGKHFSEFGIENVEQAKEVIKGAGEILETVKAYKTEIDTLKAENEKLKTNPYFADENDKRVFEWAKQYRSLDERSFVEHKMLEKTDLGTIEGKKAMEMDYILSKKTISHEDARKRFEYEYKKRFEPGELATDEDIDNIRIEKQEAEEQARENLRNLKQKYGSVDKQPESPEQMAAKLALERNMADTLTNWDKSVIDTREFTFKHGASEYRLEVGDQEKKVIDQIIKPILQDRSNYGNDGKLNVDVQFMVNREMSLLLLNKFLDKVTTDIQNKAKDEAMRAVIERQADPYKAGAAGGGQAQPVTVQSSMADGIMKTIK